MEGVVVLYHYPWYFRFHCEFQKRYLLAFLGFPVPVDPLSQKVALEFHL